MILLFCLFEENWPREKMVRMSYERSVQLCWCSVEFFLKQQKKCVY